jgi:DNA polymerase III delta prime subunit
MTQSILIVGTVEKTKEAAQNLCKENKISKFDVDTIETEKVVGIGDIRSLQKKIFLKPIESETKAVVLQAFSGMTTDSQNAFLKVLEEPPINTIVIILVTSLDFVLPTILSRCNLINLEKIRQLSKEEIEDNLKILLLLKRKDVGNALVVAQNNSKDRETALEFLQNLIVSAHSAMENKNRDFSLLELGEILKSLQKIYTIIKTTNVGPRFALENLFLNF